jgi:hypothetical protein
MYSFAILHYCLLVLPRRDVSMLISGNKDSLLRFIKNTDSVSDLGGGKGDRWV